jgi:uncharacterized protein
MKHLFILLMIFGITNPEKKPIKIFDVHIHGSANPENQIAQLHAAGVYKVAVSSSWELQERYVASKSVAVMKGLMFPCPNGKVPYSLQSCFKDNKELPSIAWVEEQIKAKKVDFLGEVLSQYYGISSSDSTLFPYYALAEKYQLPVGVHTGSAGPDHGCANFSEEMGDPNLMEGLLTTFPNLRVWIMHAGLPYLDNTIRIMKKYPHVYTDISAINNPQIVPPEQFAKAMSRLIESGLEDRIMFGSDNGQIDIMITSINALTFLTNAQREKIFYKNAEAFFRK